LESKDILQQIATWSKETAPFHPKGGFGTKNAYVA